MYIDLHFSTVEVMCIVCIGADYPHSPPTFAIDIAGDTGVQEVQVKVLTFLLVCGADDSIISFYAEH